MTVKPVGSGKATGSRRDRTSDEKTSKSTSKHHFLTSEVQKDLQDVSAGSFKKNLTYKNFVRNLTSELERSTLTSPG
jgi:hypothetical protein